MNSVALGGRITKDIEVRKTTTGISVATFTVACDKRMSKEERQKQGAVTADFINCVAWRGTADFLGAYAKKGDYVAVEGRIQTRSYDSNGHKQYVTEVIADNVELIQRNKQPVQEKAEAVTYQEKAEEVAYQGFDTGDWMAVDDSDLPF